MSLDLDKLRAGQPACPSDFAFDRLQAGELSAEEAKPLEAHAATCAECGPRLAQRRAGFAGLPALDERKLLANIRKGLDERAKPSGLAAWLANTRLMLVGLVALSAVLVAVLLLGRSSEGPGTAPEVVRTKGGLALHVYRQGPAGVEAAISGDKFAPGEKLRFVVDLPGEGFVQVVGVESSGSVYVAWPLEAGTPNRLGAGKGLELPGAVQLDQSTGRETLYLVHCPPEAGSPSCAAGGEKGKPACQPACAMTPFVLEKGR